MTTSRCILCPIDFSDTANRAVAYAVELARRLSLPLHVVHVWESPLYALAEADLALPADFETQYVSAVKARFAEALEKLKTQGIEVEGELIEGDPPVAIKEAAARAGAEMIVMGTHGRSGLAHMLLGSVTERVIRTADVPVVTIRCPV